VVVAEADSPPDSNTVQESSGILKPQPEQFSITSISSHLTKPFQSSSAGGLDNAVAL